MSETLPVDNESSPFMNGLGNEACLVTPSFEVGLTKMSWFLAEPQIIVQEKVNMVSLTANRRARSPRPTKPNEHLDVFTKHCRTW